MRDYVAGFVFDGLGQIVLLIEKRRPKWQAGLLNGIGGSIEPGESPAQAMSREFLEEAGVTVNPSAWRDIAVLSFPAGRVFFFSLFSGLACGGARAQTDEPLRCVRVSELGSLDVVPNLRFLIPLCLAADSALSGSRLDLPVQLVEVAA